MATTRAVAPRGAHHSAQGSTDLMRSWIAVALVPVAFVASFAVGEGL
jgi:hypothetical protein